MKNSRKIILVMLSIICMVILLVCSIAYYRIVVNGSIKDSTGNAAFVLRDSDNSAWNNKIIDLGKINPGDSGEFTVTMDASGSVVDMYATLEIERTNLPSSCTEENLCWDISYRSSQNKKSIRLSNR